MSSPEDLLTACATSQEERQRLISRANDALSLWDNWLHPFTSGSETGDDPAYDDNFQLMREEINKLSGTDSALLCELAQKCLCECAKDIRVVTWYVQARLSRDGEKGLSEGLLLLVAMLTRYGQACHPQRPVARKAALEWLNSAKVIDALLLWPEVDSNDAGLTAGAITCLNPPWLTGRKLKNRLLQGFVPLLKTAWHVRVAWKHWSPRTAAPRSTGVNPAHSDSPQLSAVKSGRDLLDQAKLLSRWLSEQPQGWLASHRLIKTVRWDTVDQIPHSTVAVAPAWYRRNPSIALNLSGYIFRKTGPNWLSRPARCIAKGSIISGSIFSGTSGRGSAMPVSPGIPGQTPSCSICGCCLNASRALKGWHGMTVPLCRRSHHRLDC
jgi:type VI secretion system protein VasJ